MPAPYNRLSFDFQTKVCASNLAFRKPTLLAIYLYALYSPPATGPYTE